MKRRLPAAAHQAYERLKDNPDFFKLTNRIMNKIAKINNPLKRALEVFKEVDLRVRPVLESKEVKNKISCHKGCSACCHTQVGITSDDASLYAKKIMAGEVKIDLTLLYLQSNVAKNPQAWYYLPYSQRRCVFLSQEDECMIYEHRPILCRTNFVVTPPEFCSTETGTQRPIGLLNLDEANMVIVGAFKMSDYNGELPRMLWDALSTKQKVKIEAEAKNTFPFYKSAQHSIDNF